MGRDKLSLAFSNISNEKNFVDDPRPASQKFKAFISTFNVAYMEVRGIPADWTDDQDLEIYQ